VATDAHKLVKYARTDVKSQVADFIMPKKPLTILKNILLHHAEVKIEYNDSNATFSFDNYFNVSFNRRKYPNYEA
jgi:DNA polymerase-3 subunit beta